jgi:hypothetical protein
VPAERVIAVEAATGVHRSVLRSDLYGAPVDPSVIPPAEIDELDVTRSRQYALLAILLARAPDAELLARVATLRGDASPLGLAQAALGEAAAVANVERIEREFFQLFIGIGRGELLPYASFFSPAFSTSGRWRGCAPTSSGSALRAPLATANRKIMRLCCAR